MWKDWELKTSLDYIRPYIKNKQAVASLILAILQKPTYYGQENGSVDKKLLLHKHEEGHLEPQNPCRSCISHLQSQPSEIKTGDPCSQLASQTSHNWQVPGSNRDPTSTKWTKEDTKHQFFSPTPKEKPHTINLCPEKPAEMVCSCNLSHTGVCDKRIASLKPAQATYTAN